MTEQTARPSCPDPIECGHEAALGIAEMKLGQIRAKATEWSALAPPDDWGNTPQDTALADVGRLLLRLLAAAAAVPAGQAPGSDLRFAPVEGTEAA